MANTRQPSTHPADNLFQRVFAAALGALLGLSLLKLGNPVLMDSEVGIPGNAFEWVLTGWPLVVGHGLLLLVCVLGLFVARKRPELPGWLAFAPLPWLGWQWVAAAGSMDPQATASTLIHFVANIACFYLGLFCLSPIRTLRWFWTGLMAGFLFVLLSGWQQHFGGLEASREFFFSEVYPQMNGQVPEPLMKRMSSDRIFATLFYPNTLAGAVLLLTPVAVGVFPEIFRHGSAKRIGLMLLLILAAGCLVWSGSKAGWLLMLGLGLVALSRLRMSTGIKVGIAIVILIAGSGGFLWKYSGYLQKGATSAVARLDYWEAALTIARDHPVRGTGPGTFGDAYAEVKRPESEMAHQTHNDYLQQASDSGFPGFIFYTAFIGATMAHLGRRVWRSSSPAHFWIWLGLLGITAQSLTEFGLYIPAISWPTLTLLGWMIGCATNDLDKSTDPNLVSGNT